MKTSTAPLLALKDILRYVLAYLLWLVNAVVCAAAVIQVRSTINVLWVALGGDRYALGLINQLSLILGGLAALIYVMFLESYYRSGIAHGGEKPQAAYTPEPPSGRIARWLDMVGLRVLLRRFAITTAVPLAVVIVLLAIVEVVLRSIH